MLLWYQRKNEPPLLSRRIAKEGKKACATMVRFTDIHNEKCIFLSIHVYKKYKLIQFNYACHHMSYIKTKARKKKCRRKRNIHIRITINIENEIVNSKAI